MMGHEVQSAFIPGSHAQAAIGLVDFTAVNSNPYKARLLSAPIADADVEILCFSRYLIAECRKRGWPMFPHIYFRGRAEQERAKANGNSKAAWGKSPHNFGLAVDIVHFDRYWDLSRKEWDVIGMVGKEIARRNKVKITWGGDWDFYDPAHWELKDWRERVAQDAIRPYSEVYQGTPPLNKLRVKFKPER